MMDYYSIALFLHVVGALGFFVGLALEWVSIQQLQRLTTAEQVVAWFKSTVAMRAIGGISMLVILVAGFYMMAVVWGGADWIEVAFGAMVVMGAIAGLVTGPRTGAIKRAVAKESGTISPAIDRLIHHPLLWVSMLTRVGIGLSIVYLMTVKPTMVPSLIVVVIGLVVGLAAALFTMGGRRGQEAVTQS
jgi:hypothetical protein